MSAMFDVNTFCLQRYGTLKVSLPAGLMTNSLLTKASQGLCKTNAKDILAAFRDCCSISPNYSTTLDVPSATASGDTDIPKPKKKKKRSSIETSTDSAQL